MTSTKKERRTALARLADALVEDVLATPDQELLAEFSDAHGDPAKNADAMRALFEKSVLKSNKERLRKAQAGLAASRANAGPARIINMQNARERLRRVLASCPADVKLTLAARNEDELSDADVLGMLQDLDELGIVAPNDDGGQS